jgi:hypothetical protein
MKCYDTSPPWQDSTRYGWWARVLTSEDDWFQEPSHWLLQPPEAPLERVSRIIDTAYRPAFVALIESAQAWFPR